MSDRSPGTGLGKRVLGVDAAVLPLCLGLAWLVGRAPGVVGALVGNAFGLVNLLGLAWLIARLIAGSARGQQAMYGFFIAIKLGVVLVTIYLLLALLQLHAMGFAIGYTAVMLALIGAGLLLARRAGAGPDDERTN